MSGFESKRQAALDKLVELTDEMGLYEKQGEEHMKHEKTFAAIDKLKDVELELHRLKNALEIANKAIDAIRADEREACAKVADKYSEGQKRNYSENIADEIRARGNT